MTHRHAKLAAAAVAIALAATACNGDDDSSDDTTSVAPDTTASPTTDPPPTTEPPTTSSSTTSTTGVTTTTLDIEALKAQIAQDFLRAEEAREELVRNPTLENLEARVATIAAPGSKNYEDLIEFVRGMVERGERVISGTPDYSEVIVESVELVGDGKAIVTACNVFNSARVDAAGTALDGTGVLYAVRTRQPVDLTPQGWLPSDQTIGLTSVEGATSCPPE